MSVPPTLDVEGMEQIGGKEAFAPLQAAMERGVSPSERFPCRDGHAGPSLRVSTL